MFSILSALADIGVPQERQSGEFQIRCPLHKGGMEAKPSARVYVSSDSFYCFACMASHNPISLVAAAREWSYGQALEYVRERYGVVAGGYGSGDAGLASRVIYETLLAIRRLEGDLWMQALTQMDQVLVAAAAGRSQQELLRMLNEIRFTYFERVLGVNPNDVLRQSGEPY